MTGRSGYYRATKGHKADIVKKMVDSSALAKHSLASIYREDKAGDATIYSKKVNNTTNNSCLLHQVREGQSINSTTARRTLSSTGRGSGMWGLSPRLSPDTLPET